MRVCLTVLMLLLPSELTRMGFVMNWFEAILFGIIQGVTEFLPVSSSGHLAWPTVMDSAKGCQELEMTFDVLLHSASLVAILIAFHKDIIDGLKRGPSFWMLIIIGMVPAGIAGLLIRDWVDSASKKFFTHRFVLRFHGNLALCCPAN